jgi:Cu+-exporting ATPase
MANQTDPVCGMQVDDQTAAATSEYRGVDYYFCSKDCQHEFDQQPDRYVGWQQQGSGQAQRSGSKR